MYLHSRWDKREYKNFIRPGTQTEHRYIDVPVGLQDHTAKTV